MIAENSLEETIEKVQQIPYEKRKIIISTGVHPNERTTELASNHEDDGKNMVP